jgi:hypothetical protein
VERYWREDLEVTVDRTGETAVLAGQEPGRRCRGYRLGARGDRRCQRIAADGVHLSNPAAGERGGTGDRVRACQRVGVLHPRWPDRVGAAPRHRLQPGWRTIELALELGGVSETVLHVANPEATA